MKSVKVVYNSDFGGFSLSLEAVLLARKLSGNPKWGGATIKGDIYEDSGKPVDFDYGYIDIKRTDPILVAVVEQLGSEKASGDCASLAIAIVSGPYRIDEYDGREAVNTPNDYEWEQPE